MLRGLFMTNFLLPDPGNAWGEHLIWRWVKGAAWLRPRAELSSSECGNPGSALLCECCVSCKECSAIWTRYRLKQSHQWFGSESVRLGVTNLMLSFVLSVKLLFFGCSKLNARDQQRWYTVLIFMLFLYEVHVWLPDTVDTSQGVLGELCTSKPVKDSIQLCHYC